MCCVHNTALNSSDNVHCYPPDSHHSAYDIYWRGETPDKFDGLGKNEGNNSSGHRSTDDNTANHDVSYRIIIIRNNNNYNNNNTRIIFMVLSS